MRRMSLSLVDSPLVAVGRRFHLSHLWLTAISTVSLSLRSQWSMNAVSSLVARASWELRSPFRSVAASRVRMYVYTLYFTNCRVFQYDCERRLRKPETSPVPRSNGKLGVVDKAVSFIEADERRSEGNERARTDRVVLVGSVWHIHMFFKHVATPPGARRRAAALPSHTPLPLHIAHGHGHMS